MIRKILGTLALSAVFVFGPAQAVMIGGFDVGATATFDLANTTGNFNVTNSGSFAIAAGDDTVETFVSGDGAATLALTFAAGDLVDGVGNDLVLFEIGTAETLNFSVNGTGFSLDPLDTTESITLLPPIGEDRTLNALAVDLSGIDLSAGALILLNMSDQGADFALAGALTPIPVPAAVWMFGTGLIGLVGIARRRRQ